MPTTPETPELEGPYGIALDVWNHLIEQGDPLLTAIHEARIRHHLANSESFQRVFRKTHRYEIRDWNDL